MPPDDLAGKLRQRLAIKYSSSDRTLLKLLEGYGAIKCEADAQMFVYRLSEGPRGPATVKRYLNTLRVVSPLFESIKAPSVPDPEPEPFTSEEVLAIIGWFAENCNHYCDFVIALFLVGGRISELIGLRWEDINFQRNEIIIRSSLVALKRDSHRERRQTKTGKVKRVPLSPKLKVVLENRSRQGELIFLSPKGKPINDHNFSQRYWKRCLKELGIPHRPPKNCRQTFISHALEALGSPVAVASMTHNSRSGIQTIWRHYAGLIDRPELPDLY